MAIEPASVAWVKCSGCGLTHRPRPDGRCPRCTALAGAPSRAAPPAPTAAAPAAGLAGYDEALEAFRAPPKRRSLLWLGLASAVAFVAVAVLDVPLLVAILIAVVLLLHELGHWVAMRLGGQHDARIFFIPFFGAVTTARSLPASAGARAAIALAGPVPGIVLGIVLLQLFPAPGLGRGAAVVLLYVNVLNLLPVGFLDGGRLVSSLFLARLPALEGAFALASILPMALLFGGKNASGVVGGLLVGVGFAAVRRYRIALEARSLEAELVGHRDPLALPDASLRRIHEAALGVARKDKRIKGAKQVAAVMRELFEAATAPRPTAAERVGYGFAWLAALAVGWLALAGTGLGLLS